MRVSVTLWRRQFTLIVDRRPKLSWTIFMRVVWDRGFVPETFHNHLGVSRHEFAEAARERPGSSRRIRRAIARTLGFRSWNAVVWASGEMRSE